MREHIFGLVLMLVRVAADAEPATLHQAAAANNLDEVVRDTLPYRLLFGFASACHERVVRVWQRALLQLARDAGELERVLERRVADSVHWSGTDDTPLHWAAKAGAVDVIRELAAAGASLTARGYKGGTPLHLAIFESHEDAVQALLKAGAPVTAQAENGAMPLHWAAGGFHEAQALSSPEIITMLVEAGAPLEARAAGQMTPLHMAARAGEVAAINALLEAGAFIDAKEEHGLSARFVAARAKQRGAIDVLKKFVATHIQSKNVKEEL